jgi:ubiquitin C-terminal hydrolase
MESKTQTFNGLINRGNTCYLNTSIQCLSSIPELTEYFINNDYEKDINHRLNLEKNKKEINKKNITYIILSKEYAKLIKALSSSKNSIEPKTFHQCIQKFEPTFEGFQQQDAQESLGYILDSLHEGLHYEVDIHPDGSIENEVDKLMVESITKWSKEVSQKYSIIVDLFFGQFHIKTISEDVDFKLNEVISTKYEIFNLLNVPIHGHTLNDCLNNFFGKEKLDSDFYEETSKKKVSASREFRIVKVPKYLIIVLKRFKNNHSFFTKINSIVTMPIVNLDISDYCIGYEKFNCRLNLKAVGLHTGSLNGGHYFAYCKNTNNKWYECNDSTVREIDIYDEKDNLFRNGYILIYEKIELDE